ncbi:TIGR02587 family membrane protein [Brevundimonas basaltis]|uniref:Putative integral membrane protein (TIGR02587 family) n=1 Tax=Brevundimonas basaltis TaxID=472166 RepID=A0A7W8HZJ6_9CAUL|nr:TIGR02587 family membrane protein [Brevundimonas basaltis]MBB5292758.1 putative integral membrane protein (TIGR02587 family) [Brevundimonas basaltis]
MSASLALDRRRELAYARDLARAFGGALLFSLPLLMTMEMWWFGFILEPLRLAVFLLVALPLLFGLAFYAGFSAQHRGLGHALLDTLVALAVGAITAAAVLALFGVLEPGAPPGQIVGQLTLQAVAGAMGALLAGRQLSAGEEDIGDEDQAAYPGELFLMVAGALFLALNMAPTEEMILIAYRMSAVQVIALILVSLTVMHAIVYNIGFPGQEAHTRPFAAFVHYTLAGYGLVLLTSLYVLWVFGRTQGHGLAELVDAVVVLSFPGAIGAAAARLLV